MTYERKDMTKAVLEGVAFGLKDSLDLIKNMGLPVKEIRLLGGGAKSPVWKQIIADVFGQTVYDINTNQGGALGAAILAAVGAGDFESVETASTELIKTTESYEPNLVNYERYKLKHATFQALYQHLKELF